MGEHIYRNSEKFTLGLWLYEKDLVTIFLKKEIFVILSQVKMKSKCHLKQMEH